MQGDNFLAMREYDDADLEDESMWKPAMRGGSFEYDVNLAAQGSGCVAGAYLVDTTDEACADLDPNGVPKCKTIDVMQANMYGFESKAHPCTNGQCDAVSQCVASMQK